MKLVFRGHDDRYAVEQSLLAFFPEERPVYQEPEPGEDNWARVDLHQGPVYATAVTEIAHGGRLGRGTSRALLRDVTDEYERERLRQKAVKLSFFKAARSITGVTPARVVARGVGGFTLACPDTAPGNAVLDAGGRYAGVVTRTDGDTCTVEFSAAAGLCGRYAGLVTPGQWVLTGLPADCALTAGDIVTTAGGDWLGTLAAAPAPDADGLTAQVPLTDTADLWGTVYFVKK